MNSINQIIRKFSLSSNLLLLNFQLWMISYLRFVCMFQFRDREVLPSAHVRFYMDTMLFLLLFICSLVKLLHLRRLAKSLQKDHLVCGMKIKTCVHCRLHTTQHLRATSPKEPLSKILVETLLTFDVHQVMLKYWAHTIFRIVLHILCND